MGKKKKPSTAPDTPTWQDPAWKGPYQDGITQSLLCNFLVCRERFRLLTIDGLKEDSGFNHAIEYGSMWHECEEALLARKSWQKALKAYVNYLGKHYPEAVKEIAKWYEVCKVQFPIYQDFYRRDKDTRNLEPLLQEYAFRVPYVLPSGRTILLRGKFDGVFKLGKSLYLLEHKSKGKIDEGGITGTVKQNLQVLFYLIALSESRNTLPQVSAHQSLPLYGVLYNVIRRPLSDHYAIRQRKSESLKAFYQRLGESIAEDPKHYFKRWKVRIPASKIAKFKEQTLHPILEQLCDWWEFVTSGDAWRIPTGVDCTLNPALQPNLPGGGLHYQASFGVYNSLGTGFRGDYFDFLTTGYTGNLTFVDSLFPELEPLK
jgi:hypothetical protein